MVSPRVIGHLIGMLATVQFDNDCAVETGKVTNVESDLMLTAELESSELPTAQATPKNALSVRWIFPKTTNMSSHEVIGAYKVGVSVSSIQPTRVLGTLFPIQIGKCPRLTRAMGS